MMNYSEAIEKIFSLRQMGMKLGLENIKNFLHEIGDPQLQLKTFHVAGSNGKGSTSSFIASILKESGYNVGLFTSPHFVDYNERFRINGNKIEKDFITYFINRYSKEIEDFQITFFEISAAIAFTYFHEKKVDFAAIETGLGGRLDATNTMNPLAEIITTISLEHTKILGDNLRQIAWEKGGIIKENSKVFTGLLPTAAEEEIAKICNSKKSEFNTLRNFVEQGKDYLRLMLDDSKLTLYNTGFIGRHQLNNAALAILTIYKTLGIYDLSKINNGLMNVNSNSGLEGRFEVVNISPLVIFDSAHNEEGIEAFTKAFSDEAKNCGKRILIFGAMKDKNLSKIFPQLKNQFDEFYFTTIDYHRAATIEELTDLAESHGIKGQALPGASKFIDKFINSDSTGCLAVVGSIYVLGEIKKELNLLKLQTDTPSS
jgi:dihydrofolate synthase/folylpolyglutamate synthase